MSGTKKYNLSGYTSKKHPVLEFIFQKYYNPHKPQEKIAFYLSDIAEGYKIHGIPEPVSISNTILDLTRQDRGISSRLPKSISDLGYDLRKKTGQDPKGKKYAGEFVHVGVGNALKSWLIWPNPMTEIVIKSESLPPLVRSMVRPDEGGLFSIVDYLDILSIVLFKQKIPVYRIQNPMKWQPNEIDGFYASDHDGKITLYPIEAKALTTGDEINLDQLQGGFSTVANNMTKSKINADIQPIAVKMIDNGIDIAIFPHNTIPEDPERCVRVVFEPAIINWQK